MDDFFNHDVADWITKSMSGMDDDEAEMFARFFVYEVHKQDIENNRRTLDAHVQEVTKSLMEDLQPKTREMISKAMTTQVRKDDQWETGYEKKFHVQQPRGFGGKWVAVGTTGKGKKAKTIGYHPDVGVFEVKTGKGGKVKGREPQIDITGALNRTGDAGTSFAERWTEQGPNDHRTNERTYRRVQAGSELLGKIPGAGPKTQLASQVGQFAGSFGPQAEMVIGPAARRTAYRYRGTERQADPELAKWQAGAEDHLRKQIDPEQGRRPRLGAEYGQIKNTQVELNDEQRMEASELAAQQYLAKKLPSKHLADLQLSSGRVPPSQGVIINAKGDIVTQAVGYQEDHYLPFNLKNLKGLQGGSYVRTRSSGGLTSEDIYTGLVGGARSVTVVSRSGVFTLDFDDHLRGGRRYSDKARQMVGRYAQTLDAVGSGKVAQRKLSPSERAEIRDEIEHEMEPAGYNKTQIEAKIKETEKEFAANPRMTKAEVDEIERHAQRLSDDYGSSARSEGTQRMPSDPKMRYKAFYSELYDAAMEEKSKRMYQLDADGYKAAMEALQEQFPYFVADVRHKPFEKGGSERDLGYVKAGYNRPDAAKEGYYDTNIQGYTNKQGTGKFAASEMGYQNYRWGGQRETAEGEAATGTEEDKNKVPAGAKFKSAQAKVQLESNRDAAAEAWAKEAVSLWSQLSDHHGDLQMLGKFKTNMSMAGWSPSDKRQLMTELEAANGLVGATDAYKGSEKLRNLRTRQEAAQRAERGLASRDPYDKSKWTEVSRYPKAWNAEAAHTPGADDLTVYAEEWKKTIHAHDLKDEISANDDDDDLFKRQQLWASVGARAEHQLANMGDTANSAELMNDLIKLGRDQAQTTAVMNDLAKGKKDELKQLSTQARKKTLGLARARSVKEAGGDAIKGTGGSPPNPNQAPAAAPAAGAAGPIHANPAPTSSSYQAQTPAPAKLVAKPVQAGGGHRPTPNDMPKKPSLDAVMADLDEVIADAESSGEQKQAAKQVKAAMHHGSSQEQQEAIEDLAAVLPVHAEALMTTVEHKAGNHGQMSPAMLNAIGSDMRNWVARAQLSPTKKGKLNALAGAIENQEVENIASLAADLHQAGYEEFVERFDGDIQIVLQSFS
jgi:hypothetical protein